MYVRCLSISVEQIAAYFSPPQIQLNGKMEKSATILSHSLLASNDVEFSLERWSLYKDAECALSRQDYQPSHPLIRLLNTLWITPNKAEHHDSRCFSCACFQYCLLCDAGLRNATGKYFPALSTCWLWRRYVFEIIYLLMPNIRHSVSMRFLAGVMLIFPSPLRLPRYQRSCKPWLASPQRSQHHL